MEPQKENPKLVKFLNWFLELQKRAKARGIAILPPNLYEIRRIEQK